MRAARCRRRRPQCPRRSAHPTSAGPRGAAPPAGGAGGGGGAPPAGAIAVAGDGWPEHAAALHARFATLIPCTIPPLAAVLAGVATARAVEAVGPAAVRPAYVRRPDAVVLRDQAGLRVPPDA